LAFINLFIVVVYLVYLFISLGRRDYIVKNTVSITPTQPS
jgi:hypothetical protein